MYKNFVTYLITNGYIHYLPGPNIKCLWEVDEKYPEVTFGGGIRTDEKAFLFLKRNNKIDIGVCWHCGDEPIEKQFVFTDGFNEKIEYPISRECYNEGNNLQQLLRGNKIINTVQEKVGHRLQVSETSINKAGNETKYLKWFMILIGILIFMYWMFG